MIRRAGLEIKDQMEEGMMAHGGESGFGGLVVSMLASGTRIRAFEPGRSRWIFRVSE